MAKMLWDARRAVDVLAARPEVDARRLGCIGHSLGGKEALYLAAFEPRIRAAVSCEGGIGIPFSNWEADWYLGQQAQSPTFGMDHDSLLLALVAPRAFLLIGGSSADGPQSWPYVEAALPAWRLQQAEERLGLFLHPHGHDFPPPGPEREQVYRWLDHWLAPKGSKPGRAARPTE
jgi:pimeloyl-ACP methyl ester carboxylesterase